MKTVILLIAGGIAGCIAGSLANYVRDEMLAVTIIIAITAWLCWNVLQQIIAELHL